MNTIFRSLMLASLLVVNADGAALVAAIRKLFGHHPVTVATSSSPGDQQGFARVVAVAPQATHYVSVPVTNLLSAPVNYSITAPVGTAQADKMLAQLLYNQGVVCLEVQDGWAKVTSCEHYVVSPEREATFIYGWVEADHIAPLVHHALASSTLLTCVAPWTPVYRRISTNPHRFEFMMSLSYGTWVPGIDKEDEWWQVRLADGQHAWVPAPSVIEQRPLSTHEQREYVVTGARKFLGTPYCWGGCSAPKYADVNGELDHKYLYGVDCSGMVFASGKVAGNLFPRNSRSQFYASRPCSAVELVPGDLIFLATKSSDGAWKVCHVMIYTGNGKVIESWAARDPETGAMNVQPVHEVSVSKRIGKPLEQIAWGEQVGRFKVYMGKLIY